MAQLKLITITAFLIASTCSEQSLAAHSCPIIQKPILFNAQRIKLTRAYQKKHYGIDSASIRIKPKMIVIHWTTTPTLQSAFKLFYPVMLKGRPYLEKQSKLNVSAHFLVDRDGKIYQLMPTNWMARHVIGLNHVAIGIENVGGVGDKADLTSAQLNADVCLVRMLKQQYPSIQYLIGHYEYLKFKNTPLWKEKAAGYQTKKYDPGKKFMQRLRQRVKDQVWSGDKFNTFPESRDARVRRAGSL